MIWPNFFRENFPPWKLSKSNKPSTKWWVAWQMNIMMTKKEKSCNIKPTVWLMNVCLLWHPQRAPGRAVKKRNTIKENQVGDKMGAIFRRRRIYDKYFWFNVYGWLTKNILNFSFGVLYIYDLAITFRPEGRKVFKIK